MKHLIDEQRLFESTKKEDIESICKEYNIENWILNEDRSIDVNVDVNLYFKKLNKLPIKFRNVSGYFDCSYNNLTSLEGTPKWVGGNFDCSHNNLTSLEGCPEWVGSYFLCNNNNLTSLEGGPESVGGYFYCYYNNLTSLEGSPKSVGGDFDCSHNNLTSLEGSPKSVGGNFWCDNNNLTSLERAPESIRGQFYCKNNPVEQIWNLFEDKDKIEFFNDLDIIRENLIIFDRLIYFLDAIGKPRTKEELRELIKDYTFI
jgi:hypothetical protein